MAALLEGLAEMRRATEAAVRAAVGGDETELQKLFCLADAIPGDEEHEGGGGESLVFQPC
jgi:hypothetical protein